MLKFQSLFPCFQILADYECVVRSVQILNYVKCKILHPCHEGESEMLWRFLRDHHYIWAEFLGFSDYCHLTLFLLYHHIFLIIQLVNALKFAAKANRFIHTKSSHTNRLNFRRTSCAISFCIMFSSDLTVNPQNHICYNICVLSTQIRRFRALIKGLRIQGLQITDSAIKRGAQKHHWCRQSRRTSRRHHRNRRWTQCYYCRRATAATTSLSAGHLALY